MGEREDAADNESEDREGTAVAAGTLKKFKDDDEDDIEIQGLNFTDDTSKKVSFPKDDDQIRKDKDDDEIEKTEDDVQGQEEIPVIKIDMNEIQKSMEKWN